MFKTFSKLMITAGIALGATLSAGAMAAQAAPVHQTPPPSGQCITMGADNPVLPGGGNKNCCPVDHVTDGITSQDRNGNQNQDTCSCPGTHTGSVIFSGFTGNNAPSGSNCDPAPQPCKCQPPVKDPCPVSRPGGGDPGNHHSPCPPKHSPKTPPCHTTTPKDPCGNHSGSTWK
jgi:hypothetical protein